jgi:hypothetical protein
MPHLSCTSFSGDNRLSDPLFQADLENVTPVRFLTRCAEPTSTGFIPTGIYVRGKTTLVSDALTTAAILESLTGTATLW